LGFSFPFAPPQDMRSRGENQRSRKENRREEKKEGRGRRSS
jgi:hypothetical protein